MGSNEEPTLKRTAYHLLAQSVQDIQSREECVRIKNPPYL
jgi:hypothetical protein